MRPSDKSIANCIRSLLSEYSENNVKLRGIEDKKCVSSLIEQVIDSLKRIKYIEVICERPLDERCADPSNTFFDPLKAAIIKQRNGEIDEAFWLVFLATYCGKHSKDGWGLCRDIYGQENNGVLTDWKSISASLDGVKEWLSGYKKKHNFSNHRKYLSLRNDASIGTANVFRDYVRFIGHNKGHKITFEEYFEESDGSNLKFDKLFKNLKILSFGRLGKFDYLCMLGKLELLDIKPESSYLVGATGPQAGAQLLFNGREGRDTPKMLDKKIIKLGEFLVEQIDCVNEPLYNAAQDWMFQVLEDALCNWQKSPDKYLPFHG